MTARVAVTRVPPEAGAAPGRRRPGRVVTRLAMTVAVVVATASAVSMVPTFVGTGDTTRLEVWDHEAGAAIYTRDVEPGETFELEHTHSVTGRLVVETFSVQDADTIALEELWFDQHGANLPTGAERIGDTTTTYLEEDGAYRVLHHGHAIGTLPLLVGSAEVDHVVTFEDGERLRLLDVARPGGRVELSVGDGR